MFSFYNAVFGMKDVALYGGVLKRGILYTNDNDIKYSSSIVYNVPLYNTDIIILIYLSF